MPPRLDDETRELLGRGERGARRLIQGFFDFAFSGNILEIAFGLILAAGFTSVTTSFVSDILLPPLSVLFPLNKNLDEKFSVLQEGPNYAKLDGYNTVMQAREDGAVILAWGAFCDKCLNFLGLGLALYGLAMIYQSISKDPIVKHMVKCRYCKKHISEKAKRCVNCTSWQDGREDRTR